MAELGVGDGGAVVSTGTTFSVSTGAGSSSMATHFRTFISAVPKSRTVLDLLVLQSKNFHDNIMGIKHG